MGACQGVGTWDTVCRKPILKCGQEVAKDGVNKVCVGNGVGGGKYVGKVTTYSIGR